MTDNPKKRSGRFTQWNKTRLLLAAERQRIVAQLTLEGLSNEDIATRLGVSVKTIERDQEANMDYISQQKRPDLEVLQERVRRRYQELEDDVESAHVNGQLGIEKRTALACGILKDLRDLLGLDAPTKSISAHVEVDGTGRFHRFIQAAAGLSDEQLEQVFRFAQSIERKPLELPPGPPPLQLTEGEQ